MPRPSPLSVGTTLRSWSTNCPSCIRRRLWEVSGLGGTSLTPKDTRRGLGSRPPLADLSLIQAPSAREGISKGLFLAPQPCISRHDGSRHPQQSVVTSAPLITSSAKKKHGSRSLKPDGHHGTRSPLPTLLSPFSPCLHQPDGHTTAFTPPMTWLPRVDLPRQSYLTGSETCMTYEHR